MQFVSKRNTSDKGEINQSDSANGIPEKIFQRSFTIKPTLPGTGLRLSLAQDIVKADRDGLKNRNEGIARNEFYYHVTSIGLSIWLWLRRTLERL